MFGFYVIQLLPTNFKNITLTISSSFQFYCRQISYHNCLISDDEYLNLRYFLLDVDHLMNPAYFYYYFLYYFCLNSFRTIVLLDDKSIGVIDTAVLLDGKAIKVLESLFLRTQCSDSAWHIQYKYEIGYNHKISKLPFLQSY